MVSAYICAKFISFVVEGRIKGSGFFVDFLVFKSFYCVFDSLTFGFSVLRVYYVFKVVSIFLLLCFGFL